MISRITVTENKLKPPVHDAGRLFLCPVAGALLALPADRAQSPPACYTSRSQLAPLEPLTGRRSLAWLLKATGAGL
jgi:hypothetical protein